MQNNYKQTHKQNINTNTKFSVHSETIKTITYQSIYLAQKKLFQFIHYNILHNDKNQVDQAY